MVINYNGQKVDIDVQKHKIVIFLSIPRVWKCAWALKYDLYIYL